MMILLLYERVPAKRHPENQHFDDPVVQYFPLNREFQTHTITDLPRGMYILCGEAMMASGSGQILEASCLQAEIVKKSEHKLQNGVQVMIFVAFIIVALVVIYAILFQVRKKIWLAGNSVNSPKK